MKKGVEMEVDTQSAKAAITAEQLLAQIETSKHATESNQSNIAQHVNMSLITCDERCITVYDANELTDFKDEALIGRTQNCLNLLFEKLAALPTENTEEGIVVKLPAPKTVLPRFKRLPKRDEFQTKWERFARVKGIQKKKRSSKVFDPETQRWKPRFGYDPEAKNNEKQSDWLIEVPSNGDPYEDQFAKRANDKRERVAKNELQRLRNMSRKMKFNDNSRKPADWPIAENNRKPTDWPTADNNRKPADWPSADNSNKNGGSQRTKSKIGVGVLPEIIPHGAMARGTAQHRFAKLSRAHQDVKLAYENARVATASLGRFDQRTRRETNLEKETKVLKNRSIKDPQIGAKRVHFDDGSAPTNKKAKANGHSSGPSGVVDVRSEKESYMRVLDSLAARRTATKPINESALQKAANRATAQEQSDRAQSKVMAGKGDASPKRSGKQAHGKSKFGNGKRKFEPKRFDQSNGKENGGFKGGSKGGFKGGSKGGFKGGSKGGFKGGSKGGFTGGSKGGFKGGSKGGFTGGGKGGFKGGNKGGFKGRKGK